MNSGPINCFIKNGNNRLKFYSYDSTGDQYVSEDPEHKPIRRDSTLRYRIIALKFNMNDFDVMGTIEANYLGPT